MKELVGLAVLSWPYTLTILILSAFVVVILLFTGYAVWQGKKPWGWVLLGFSVVFLSIFWDWIPTVVTHKYYCATEAGFWIYKTPEQWRKENPGVIEALIANRPPVLVSHGGDADSWTDVEMLNQRVKLISKRNGPLFLHRWRWEGQWVDSKNNETLARYVDFYTSYERRQGGWSGWKFWLATHHCPGYQQKAVKFSKTIQQYKGTEK